MTPDQARQLDAVLEAAEHWLMEIIWKAGGGRGRDPVEARNQLIAEIDELLSAMELDEDHNGLGRGGRP